MTSTSSLPWVDPGAFEVADGVWRVPLPLPNDGLKAVNVYVLVTPDGLVCVDGGWAIPSSRELFEQALRTIGFAVADVGRFLVTHVHRDHYTQAVAIPREAGSHLSVGPGEKPTTTPPRPAPPRPASRDLSNARGLTGTNTAWRGWLRCDIATRRRRSCESAQEATRQPTCAPSSAPRPASAWWPPSSRRSAMARTS